MWNLFLMHDELVSWLMKCGIWSGSSLVSLNGAQRNRLTFLDGLGMSALSRWLSVVGFWRNPSARWSVRCIWDHSAIGKLGLYAGPFSDFIGLSYFGYKRRLYPDGHLWIEWSSRTAVILTDLLPLYYVWARFIDLAIVSGNCQYEVIGITYHMDIISSPY